MTNSSWLLKKISSYKFALIFASSFLLSACGSEGLTNVWEQQPSLGEASSGEAASRFTGQVLSDGSIRFKWEKDPAAVNYLIVNNGKVIATVPASVLTAVMNLDDGSDLENGIEIISVDALDVRKQWASSPIITQKTPVETVPTVTLPTELPATLSNTSMATHQPSSGLTATVVEPPTEVIPPVVDVPPTEVIPPVVDVPPTEVIPPVVDVPPTEVIPPVVDVPPTEVIPPVVDVPPTKENPPIQVVNLAPNITDTSYNCDPVSESAHFTVGQTDHFTLSVVDESPLSLMYSVESSTDDIVSVEVDSNGIFTITALQTGDLFLWLSAEDDAGLVDEYELRVVVQ